MNNKEEKLGFFDLVKYIEHLENNYGRLSFSPTRIKWADGTVTDGAWIYSSGDFQASGKTAIEAIKQHIQSTENYKLIKSKKVNSYDM